MEKENIMRDRKMKGVFKKTRALICVLLMAVLAVLVIPQKSDAAAYNQDEILFYGIEARLLDNGSVHFTYRSEEQHV